MSWFISNCKFCGYISSSFWFCVRESTCSRTSQYSHQELTRIIHSQTTAVHVHTHAIISTRADTQKRSLSGMSHFCGSCQCQVGQITWITSINPDSHFCEIFRISSISFPEPFLTHLGQSHPSSSACSTRSKRQESYWSDTCKLCINFGPVSVVILDLLIFFSDKVFGILQNFRAIHIYVGEFGFFGTQGFRNLRSCECRNICECIPWHVHES